MNHSHLFVVVVDDCNQRTIDLSSHLLKDIEQNAIKIKMFFKRISSLLFNCGIQMFYQNLILLIDQKIRLEQTRVF